MKNRILVYIFFVAELLAAQILHIFTIKQFYVMCRQLYMCNQPVHESLPPTFLSVVITVVIVFLIIIWFIIVLSSLSSLFIPFRDYHSVPDTYINKFNLRHRNLSCVGIGI